jgi:transposase
MQLLSGGTHAARKLKRAQVLLAADSGASNEEIARSIGVGKSTVERYDCEYRRNGTANLFVFVDVSRPWRKVK